MSGIVFPPRGFGTESLSASVDEARERAGGLRPAQAGVVLDRGPHSAHLVATLVDLALRGHLRIESDHASNKADCLLIRTRAAGFRLRDSGDLVRYERRLLRGVFGRQREVRLAKIAPPRVNQVYTQLTREAFSYGWIDAEAPQGRRRPDTEADRLRTHLRALRMGLSRLHPQADADPVTFYSGWLPYAISFRIAPSWMRYTALLASPPLSSKSDFPEQSQQIPLWWSAAVGTFPSPRERTGGGHHGGFDGGHHGGHDHGGHHHGGFDGVGHHSGGHGF